MNPVVAIDFDGTIVEHAYPNIGKPCPHAIRVMRRLREMCVEIVLFTMRSGDPLQEAVDYIESNGIDLYGVNVNPTQHTWTESPKAYAKIYIDDAALGCPLRPAFQTVRPMVDWLAVEKMLEERGIL